MSIGMAVRSWLKSAPQISRVFFSAPSGVLTVRRPPNTSEFCMDWSTLAPRTGTARASNGAKRV